MKKLVIILSLFMLSASLPAAAFSPNIPAKTLQVAREAEIKEAINAPKSQVVRVGIGNSGFRSYVYNNAGVYGTSDIMIFDKESLIEKLPANININIKYKDGMFELSEDDGTIITSAAGPVRIICPKGLLGVKGLKRAGKNALYHGAFEFVKANANQFNLINMIEVEDYLKGVVPNEMPVTFGLEALKAQSVAARNYVLSPRVKASPNYDVVDSVASQVYFGASTERELSNQAVLQTEGVVALYGWDLILAQYSSTAGGYTESYSNAFSDPNTKNFPAPEKPYLKAKPDILSQTPLNTEEAASAYYKSKPDAYDIRSSYFRWTKEWQADELKKALEQTIAVQSATGFVKPAFNKGDTLGDLIELKVVRRGESGKIIEMEVVTTTGKYKIFKELVVRRLLTKNGSALPSANVVFENVKDESGKLISIKAYGGGFGHGVGMSQYGAGFMGSELHLPYEKILQHYYTGITLGTKPVIISGDSSQSSVLQNFYTNEKYASIVVDNKFQVSKLTANINGKEYSFNLPVSIWGASRVTNIDISNYIKKGRNTIVFYYPMEEGNKKALRLYVELVKKDDSSDIW